ncbi:MAG: response regulator [Calditrichia bacterium]|nr:response regulator [Calditrichia bacterium]
MKKKKYITVNQVAEYLEVSKQAVNKWINNNELKVYRLPSGRIKILRSDFLYYLEENDLYVDKDFFKNGDKKIVIIDDNEQIFDLFKTFFHNINSRLKIEYDSNGISGLLTIGSLKPDIVILDIEIPGINGIEVCRKILNDKSLSHIKIVIVSGYIHKYQDEIEKLAIATIINKPFRLIELENKLMPLLNQN